jgi:multicomponent Na+:H+ antiporter subunit D
VAQIAYIILGLSFNSVTGLTASIVHMVNHGVTKGALFMLLGGVATVVGGVGFKDIRGLGRRMPLTSLGIVIGGLSLIGIPGTAGFISKWLLLSAALEQGPVAYLLVAIILVSSLMALVYVWRVVETLYFKTAVVAAEGPGEAPLQLLLVTWIVALANIGFGLFPQFPLALSSAAAKVLLAHSL